MNRAAVFTTGRRACRWAAVAAALAVATTLTGAPTAPDALAQGVCAAPPPPSGVAVFAATGGVQHVRVPRGVDAIRVDVRGGHGGQEDSTGAGGAGGRVLATLPVAGGECLNVYVGGYGGDTDTFGWGTGGNHGKSYSETSKTGGNGGGASAISRGAPEQGDTPLAVGGGGGGGGGKGDGPHDGAQGGPGANGDGPDTPRGSDGFTPPAMPYPGELLGGDGGGRDDSDGGEGKSVYTHPNAGAGGGGGSGINGGDGGLHWVGTTLGDLLEAVGGGGGGGGSSYAERAATEQQFLVADTTDCPVGGGAAACDGAVTISWVERPTSVAPFAGSGQAAVITSPLPTPLQAKVTALSGDPIGGAQVTFTLPSAGATGSFDDGEQGTVATATTNDGGIATSPPIVAGRTAGPWTARATVAHVDDEALYALANEPAPTVMAAFTSAGPSVVGEPVRFSAVVGASPSSVGIATGRVQFRLDGDDVDGPITLDAAGTATTTARPLALGDHQLDVVYDGGADFVTSVASLTQRVERARAAVTVTSSENPSALGDPITFTADVEPAAPATGTPTGSVEFRIGEDTLLGSIPLQDGRATSRPPTATELPQGFGVVTAVYTGDSSFDAAGGTLEQSVGPAATSTVVESSLRSALFGEPLTLTATVTSPDGEDPAGAVDFAIAGEAVGCDGVTLEGNQAECMPAEPPAPGLHAVTARYRPGSLGFEPSQGRMVQRVEPGRVNVTIEAVPAPSVFGMTYTLHADVAAAAPANGAPGGVVTFRVDGADVGEPVMLDDEGATMPARASMPAGAHVVEAAYAGDGRFAPARGVATPVVDRAITAASITTPAGTGAYRLALDVLPPGAGEPTGTVQFFVDGARSGGAVAIRARSATSAPVAVLDAGSHDVRAAYSGDRDFAPSDATTLQPVDGPPPGGGGPGGPVPPGDSPPAPRPKGPVRPPQPSLLCGKAVALTDVRLAHRRIVLGGVADPQLVGRRVTLSGGRGRDGRATVRSDGTFAARIPRAPGAGGGPTRYRATVARHRSAAVALKRRLRVTGVRNAAGGLRVTLELAGGAHRALVVGRQPGCSARQAKRLRRVRADGHGRATVTLARPRTHERLATYRVWTPNRAAYSLPIVVRARKG
jgi:hypothetical protein